MYNSKIAFCPPGNVSNETYRFYEAMFCGCVIVCPVTPKTEIYYNLPVCEVEDFENMGAITTLELLKDDERMKQIQQQSLEYWEKKYSPSAMAQYILSKIGK